MSSGSVAVVGLHLLSPFFSQMIGDDVGDSGGLHVLIEWETMVGGALVWETNCWSDICNTTFLVWNSDVLVVLALS